MVKKKKDILIDVGSNSGLGYSVGEDAEVANNPAHASTPHYKPGLEKKKDFEHEIDDMIKGAETPEHHGLISELHLHAPHGSEPFCSPPSSPSPASTTTEAHQVKERVLMGMKELEVLEEAPKVPTHISAPHRLDSAIKEVTENHPHPETGKANPTPPSKARHTSPQKQSDYKPRHEWMGSGSSAIDNAFHVGSPAESPGGLPRQAPGHNVHPPPMSPMMSMRRAPADKGDEDEFYI